MYRKLFMLSAVVALTVCTLSLASCDGGSKSIADTSTTTTQEANGTVHYYTDTNMSALEYKMYLANKISVATGQINTHMSKLKNVGDKSCTSEDEIEALASSIKILKDDKRDLTYIYPPDEYSATRENALTYWQNAIDEMTDASEKLENGNLSKEELLKMSSSMSDIYTSIQSLNSAV